MTISDLTPWKTKDHRLSGRQRTENRMLDLRTQMDRLFDEFYSNRFDLSPFFKGSDELGDFSPRVDIDETENMLTVSAELPGLKPEDVDISLKDNLLTISGEKRAEKEDKNKHYYHVERSYGSFSRTIPLTSEVEEGKIEASLKDGLLKITLPKSKEAQEKSKPILIKTE